MRFRLKTPELELLFYTGQSRNLPIGVVKAFIKAIRVIDAAQDERDLRAAKGKRMEKLSGSREGQYSLRLNDQYRLVFTIEKDMEGNYLIIIEIVDYH